MGGTAAIAGAVIAAAGTGVSIAQSAHARKDAQGAADAQAKTQADLLKKQKLGEENASTEAADQLKNSQQKLNAQNAGGYSSTIATTPIGLTGPSVTGGQKTLLGS